MPPGEIAPRYRCRPCLGGKAALPFERPVAAHPFERRLRGRSGRSGAALGPDPPRTPIQQRSWYPEIASAPDPPTLLRRWAEILCEVNARVAPVQRIVQSAAASDPHIAQLWQRMKDQRLIGQSAIAQLLAERQVLRPGLSVGQAADIIFVLSDAYVYDAYVRDRGWSPTQAAQWLGDAFCALLL